MCWTEEISPWTRPLSLVCKNVQKNVSARCVYRHVDISVEYKNISFCVYIALSNMLIPGVTAHFYIKILSFYRVGYSFMNRPTHVDMLLVKIRTPRNYVARSINYIIWYMWAFTVVSLSDSFSFLFFLRRIVKGWMNKTVEQAVRSIV